MTIRIPEGSYHVPVDSTLLRAKPIWNQDGTKHSWYVFCPACNTSHIFDSRWTFVNNNLERPTFRDSMLVYSSEESGAAEGSSWPRCHSYVTDGSIQYLGDCTHKMAGQTVLLGEAKLNKYDT